MSVLVEVFADFARLEERPGFGLSVPLGREDIKPELAHLASGERIILVGSGNLRAEGVAKVVESGGHRWWFGVLDGLGSIRDIHPETLKEAERSSAL